MKGLGRRGRERKVEEGESKREEERRGEGRRREEGRSNLVQFLVLSHFLCSFPQIILTLFSKAQ